MNVMREVLALQAALTERREKDMEKSREDGWRTRFHVMPPVGWLNDPNGLCQFQEKYYFFFQYSPFSAEGGLKFWGLYTSSNLTNWSYEGIVLYPDSPWDCHGVYSGSAFTEDGELELFYTGNVKLEGDYDHINRGREAYVLFTKSQDGKKFVPKERLLGMEDYPKEYTCHIRDPKVWKEGDRYHMVLGGRKKNDQGAVLLYSSGDKKKWEYVGEITTSDIFGYMWECPDLFRLQTQQVLSVCPQGVPRQDSCFQNLYASGYFFIEPEKELGPDDFREWDMGFDFYAPQTFLDDKGRRILVAWASVPDTEKEYVNPTVERGWQHVLTTPRELRLEQGKVYQYPVSEIDRLRTKEIPIWSREDIRLEKPCFDLEIKEIEDGGWEILIEEECRFSYKDKKAILEFTGSLGAGRKRRKAWIEEIKTLRILADTSLIEIYVNDGEYVFTSRFYPKNRGRQISLKNLKGALRVYQL